jgi:RNA polymerase sigma-70 factor (ECF subfamily)
MDLSGPVPATTTPTDALPEAAWVTPIADHEVSLHTHDPAARAEARDSLRLAFVAALQHLPPRQRAVLILREALCWSAAETAELLDTTVASVNSALQRARATLSDRRAADGDRDGDQPTVLDDADKDLLARYVAAFESYDIDRLVTLLRDDASISMPPIAMWLRGRDQLHDWYLGHGIGCRGSWLVPIAVNGSQGFAQYRRGPDGSHVAWSIQVLEVSAGLISHVHHFLDTALFATFGLPLTLESRPA